MNKQRITSSRLARSFVVASVGFAISALYSQQVMAAQTNDQEVQQLQASLKALQARLDKLETQKTTDTDDARLLPEGLTIYGILDSGVEHVTNVGSDKKSDTRIPSTTGSFPSRLGFNFRHQATDNVAAVAKAEMGVYLDSGDSGQSSRLFGRQIYVGLDFKDIGAITFGRQYNMMWVGTGPGTGDLMGPNIYGLGALDAYVPNGRADNTIAYNGKFGAFTLGATYSFGRDSAKSGDATVPRSGVCSGEDASDTSSCKDWSAMIKYDQKRYNVTLAYDEQSGGSGAYAYFFNGIDPFTLTDAKDYDRRTTLNGWFNLSSDFRVGWGWLGREAKSYETDTKVSQDTYWLQGQYQFTKAVKGNLAVYNVNNDDMDTKATLYSAKVEYAFDKHTAVYLSLAFIDNNKNGAYGVSGGGSGTSPAAGNDQVGTMVGARYRF